MSYWHAGGARRGLDSGGSHCPALAACECELSACGNPLRPADRSSLLPGSPLPHPYRKEPHPSRKELNPYRKELNPYRKEPDPYRKERNSYRKERNTYRKEPDASRKEPDASRNGRNRGFPELFLKNLTPGLKPGNPFGGR